MKHQIEEIVFIDMMCLYGWHDPNFDNPDELLCRMVGYFRDEDDRVVYLHSGFSESSGKLFNYTAIPKGAIVSRKKFKGGA